LMLIYQIVWRNGWPFIDGPSFRPMAGPVTK
jgi:hypothetical protein